MILDGLIKPTRSDILYIIECYNEYWWKLDVNSIYSELKHYYN